MSAPTAVHGGTAPLAALTSVFTPPCPTSWLLTTTRAPSQYPPFPTTGPPSCDPPSWRTNIARAGFHYYSPAICPAGFVVGPNCGIAKVRTDEGFPAIEPGETAAYCVPIGLTCTTDLTDFRGGVWGFARAAATPGALVTVGPAIQIRWVEADLTMLETHPLTPGLKVARTGVPETFSAAVQQQSSTSVGTSTTTSAPDKKPTAQNPDPSSSTLTTETRNNNNDDFGVTQIFDTGSRTSTLGPANTASGNLNGSGGLGSLDRTTSIVVIVVVTVVAGIALWVAAFLLVRRYKKRVMRGRRTPGDGTSLEHGGGRHRRANSGIPKSIGSPMSELEPGPPAIGSTPNPAELEGEVLQPPARSWLHRASRVRHSSQHLQPPPYSPWSMASTAGSGRRTVRESFGEKVNDPAAALGRLRIPNPLSMSMSMGRQSPSDASPRNASFWRGPRSPRSPAGGARMSRQLSKSAMGPPGGYMPG